MDRTRLIFVAILGMAALAICGLVSFSYLNQAQPVVGLSGSEKIPFFEDERVQEALRKNGLEVSVQKAGSRQIATNYNLCEFDFAFPAGVPAAEKIQQQTNPSCPGQTYDPFFYPHGYRLLETCR